MKSQGWELWEQLCEWLHRNRFNWPFQDVKGCLTPSVSTSSQEFGRKTLSSGEWVMLNSRDVIWLHWLKKTPHLTLIHRHMEKCPKSHFKRSCRRYKTNVSPVWDRRKHQIVFPPSKAWNCWQECVSQYSRSQSPNVLLKWVLNNYIWDQGVKGEQSFS